MLISSKDNRIVKDAVKLREKKYRDASGCFLLEGPGAVLEAARQGGRLRFIFTRAGAALPELEELLSGQVPAVYELTDDVFARVSDAVTPQGALAVAEKPVWSEADLFGREGGNVLVLDRVQDPGNLGTLIRTAEAMGFTGALLVKGCCDPWSPKVVRSAAGSLLRLPVLQAEDAAEALALLKKHGKTCWCAVMDGETACFDADLAKDAAVVIGNEGGGASEEFKNASPGLSIPMAGKTESLNAAYAGAIIMYESLRQRMAVEK